MVRAESVGGLTVQTLVFRVTRAFVIGREEYQDRYYKADDDRNSESYLGGRFHGRWLPGARTLRRLPYNVLSAATVQPGRCGAS